MKNIDRLHAVAAQHRIVGDGEMKLKTRYRLHAGFHIEWYSGGLLAQPFTYALVSGHMQIYSWDFDVFALDKATCGNPLITMTIALLESFDLLVRSWLYCC